MVTISTVNPSIGTEESEAWRVRIQSSKIESILAPIEMISESDTGSATYYGEIVVTAYTVIGFKLTGTSTTGSAAFTVWSTDDADADVADDNDWTDVTKMVMDGAASLSGADVEDIYRVVTHITSRKLRVKCIVTGGTTHTISADALIM